MYLIVKLLRKVTRQLRRMIYGSRIVVIGDRITDISEADIQHDVAKKISNFIRGRDLKRLHRYFVIEEFHDRYFVYLKYAVHDQSRSGGFLYKDDTVREFSKGTGETLSWV